MDNHAKKLLAQAEAWDEAAEHLGQRWTEDPTEKTEGNSVAEVMRQYAEEARTKADCINGNAKRMRPIIKITPQPGDRGFKG